MLPRRPRTLLIPRMLLLLTGGAIINVAVAWGCAVWSTTSEHSRVSGIEEGMGQESFDRGFGIEITSFVIPGSTGEVVVATGWPTRSLNYTNTSTRFAHWTTKAAKLPEWIAPPGSDQV